jgi:hypothetical protein
MRKVLIVGSLIAVLAAVALSRSKYFDSRSATSPAEVNQEASPGVLPVTVPSPQPTPGESPGARVQLPPMEEIPATSIEEYISRYNTRSNRELRNMIRESDARIAQSKFVERGNQGLLSAEEKRAFAEELNRKSALQILIIDRQLASIEGSLK